MDCDTCELIKCDVHGGRCGAVLVAVGMVWCGVRSGKLNWDYAGD